MCQGWTNSETCIKKQTGLGIGVVKIKGKNRYHEYDVCDKDKVNDGGADYIYDSNTCNFHFLPVLASDEVVDTLKYYLAAAEDVTNKIYDILNEKHHRVNVSKGNGNFFNAKRFPQAYRDKGLANAFFKYVSFTDSDRRQYTINFMRWYIEDGNVNCILGEIQFDTTRHGLGYVNRKGEINYPNTQEKQALNEIKTLKGNNEICIFNPNVGDIWEISNDENKLTCIVDAFESFIARVKEVAK